MSRAVLGIEIPERYRAARSLPAAPPPPLDWWRGFRSRELTTLVEEAQTANFDIAAAIARIIQADAQSKVAGAPLLAGRRFRRQRDALAPAGRAGSFDLPDRGQRQL